MEPRQISRTNKCSGCEERNFCTTRSFTRQTHAYLDNATPVLWKSTLSVKSHCFANLEKHLLWVFQSVVPNLSPIRVVDCKLKCKRVFVEPLVIFETSISLCYKCLLPAKMRYSTKKKKKKKDCNTNDYRSKTRQSLDRCFQME